MSTTANNEKISWACEACHALLIKGQNQVGTWIWVEYFTSRSAPCVNLDEPSAIVCLCISCKLQGFLFERGEVRIWPKSRADVAMNTHPRSENEFNPWIAQPTDSVFCNISWSGHYHANCSPCWLGQSHNWAKHYQSLLHFALRQQFGERWQWDSEKEREMCMFEHGWWKAHAPFNYNERRDRQTPYW